MSYANIIMRRVIIIYFTNLKRKYLDAIIKLEEKSYPQELVLGSADLLEDYEKTSLKDYSICCFAGGELMGYITAYRSEELYRTIYISDLNCPNPKYLRRLLMKFFMSHSGFMFEADFRENSYYLLVNQQKKDSEVIQILEQKCMPQFYNNGEMAYHVRFTVYVGKYLERNWKNSFQNHLDSMVYYDYDNLMNYAFQSIYELTKKGVNFYEEKNMKFVIGCMVENILDYYKMFGDNIPYVFNLTMFSRTAHEGRNAFEKSILKLEELGFNEGGTVRGYSYNKWLKRLCVIRKGVIRNTQYPDRLSGVRWLWKSQLQYEEKRDRFRATYFNKYGVIQEMIKVPYLTKKNYLYYMNRVILELKLLEEIKVDGLEKKSLHKIIVDTYFLLGSKEASKCVSNIAERYIGTERNYFHDWGVILDDMKSIEDILTKGAMVAVLSGSYNQALRICKQVISVKQTVLDDSLAKRLYSVKDIRNNLSRLIRNRQDYISYIKELCKSVNDYYSKKLEIPVSLKKKISEYMERIQKYVPSMTIYTLYRIFGKESLVQFILGTYRSVFSSKIIYPSYNGLCTFVIEFLQKRTAKAKCLYGKLLKKGLLSAIMNGDVTLEQYKEILKMLKHHNILNMDDSIKNLCDFKAFIEPKGSPEFLVAGDATVCCMSLGTEKARIYAIEEGFGVLNIYYCERIIANSVIWINSPYKCLVLDNIEVHPNYTKYSRQIELCFCAAAEYLMEEQQLDYVVQGLSYNDLILYHEDTEESCFEKMKPLGVQIDNFYSDAKYYKVIMQTPHNLGDINISGKKNAA